MCGIVGYVGSREVSDILIKGLRSLEYRGYDSAGIAVISNSNLNCIKAKGSVDNLANMIGSDSISANIGIGHTRWATHGEPSDVNAHPHIDCKKRFSVVHNGIIENYEEIKKDLFKSGHIFASETDTEVIVHLIEEHYNKDIVSTMIKICPMLLGSYTMAVLDKDNPEQIIAVRKDSPLVVGVGENENFISSDIQAILSYTNNVFILEDNEMALISKDNVKIMNCEGKELNKEVFVANWSSEELNKADYEDYMLKEIFEQPNAIRKTLEEYLKSGEVELPLNFSKNDIDEIERITIIACGTASYAGRVGEYILEELTGISVKVEVGSEYRYKKTIIDKNNLIIVISQSGETADTLASMRKAMYNSAKIIGITNTRGSTVSRELENVIHTFAGPEIAVASTKAFITQLATLCLIGLYIAKSRGSISDTEYNTYIQTLRTLPTKIEKIFTESENIKNISKFLSEFENMFFIGRLADYPIALEGAHKLKEISYIHAEAYEAGELKHGTLALVSNNTPIVCLSTIESVYNKTKSNIAEVQARNATIINLRSEIFLPIEGANFEIVIPDSGDLFQPLLTIVPLQLLAYYTAKNRGCNVDKPRNLAKSVTVE